MARQTKRLQEALGQKKSNSTTTSKREKSSLSSSPSSTASVSAALKLAIDIDVTNAAVERDAQSPPPSPLGPQGKSPSKRGLATGDSPTGIPLGLPPFSSLLDSGPPLEPSHDDEVEDEGVDMVDVAETEVATGGIGAAQLVVPIAFAVIPPDQRELRRMTATASKARNSLAKVQSLPPPMEDFGDDEDDDEAAELAAMLESEAKDALVARVREQAMMIATLTDALHSVELHHSTAARDEHASAEPSISSDAPMDELQSYFDDHVAIIDTLCRALNASEEREDAL